MKRWTLFLLLGAWPAFGSSIQNPLAVGGSSGQIEYNSGGVLAGIQSSVTAAGVTISTPTAILGTITNDNASVGYYGEYISSSTAGANANFQASGSYGDLLSVSLSSGDWNVTFCATGILNGAVDTGDHEVGISATSGNSSTGLIFGDNASAFYMSTALPQFPLCISDTRFSLAVRTTLYAKYRAGSYTGGPPEMNGRLSARRMR